MRRDLTDSDKIVGSFFYPKDQSLDFNGFMTLDKRATQGTIHHETFHAAARMALTDKQMKVMLDRYGSEEKAAKAYQKWNPKDPNRLFGKIRDFVQSLIDHVITTPEGVMRQIRSGKIWEQGKSPEQAGRMYSIEDENLKETEAQTLHKTLADALQSGKYDDISFGKLSDDRLKSINAIRERLGRNLIVDGNLVIPAHVVEKFYKKRMIKEGMSANQVADMVLRVFHAEETATAASKYPDTQALINVRGKRSDIGIVGRNSETGGPVAITAYPFHTERLPKRLGWEIDQGGQSSPPSIGSEKSYPQADRFSARQDDLPTHETTPGGRKVKQGDHETIEPKNHDDVKYSVADQADKDQALVEDTRSRARELADTAILQSSPRLKGD